MRGRAGEDVLNLPESTPVFVLIHNGEARGEGTVVLFATIEALVGSDGEDRFVAGGRDLALDGGGGVDTTPLRTQRTAFGSTFEPASSPTGTPSNVSSVIGSPFADRIGGSTLPNLISGHDGADVITGLGGFDTLLGGAGDDHLDGGGGTDECHGGGGVDVLVSC